MDTNLAPPKIFAGAEPRPGTGADFDSLSWDQMTSLSDPKASLLRRSLFRTREVPQLVPGSKKQPFAQGVIVNP